MRELFELKLVVASLVLSEVITIGRAEGIGCSPFCCLGVSSLIDKVQELIAFGVRTNQGHYLLYGQAHSP